MLASENSPANPQVLATTKELLSKPNSPLQALHSILDGTNPATPLTVPDPTVVPVTNPVELPANPVETDPDGDPVVTPAPVELPAEGGEPSAEELLENATSKPKQEENFKNLRLKTKNLEKTVEEKEKLLAELHEKLTKYDTGEVLPEPAVKLKEEVEKLKHYESIHGLLLSEEYQEQIIAPLENLKTEARGLAEDYKVNPSVFDHAMQLENKRERNAFLRKHFDDVGALEASKIIDNINNKLSEAAEAEAQPEVTLNNMRAQRQEQLQQVEQARLSSIETNSKAGYTEALNELRSSGEYPELSLTGNPEADNVITNILNSAAGEYGKLVTNLGLKGTKDLSKSDAKILAKWALLSHAAALSAASRAEFHKANTTLLETTKRQSSMIRPALGKTTGFGGPSNEPVRVTHKNAASLLLNSLPK